jgi:hypothetical protein
MPPSSINAINPSQTNAPAVAGKETHWPPSHASNDRALAAETRTGWVVLGLVWVASAAYLGEYLRHGWVPHDAGTLAQMAERVLYGQVPYRDFREVYTGGLTYFNALAFRMFGVNFFSLRIPLFLLFLGWVPSVYLIARRFSRPIAAGAVTLLAVAWSVPNYPEGMPSWYNLFFATWGVLALIRYMETDRRRWLWIAGFCGGLSFLVKITALYFIAAALLFFVFREVSLSRVTEARPARGAVLYRIFASGGLLLFLAGLTRLVSRASDRTDFFYFVLPSACLVFLVVWELWHKSAQGSPARFRLLFSMVLPFLGGVLVPIALFLGYFYRVGALGAWFSGILGASVRLNRAVYNPPSPVMIVGLVPMGLVLYLAYKKNLAIGRWAWLVATAALGITLVLARMSIPVYAAVYASLPALVPIFALVVVVRLRREVSLSGEDRQRIFLLAAAAVVCALIQFPFSSFTYFCYVTPLVILLLVCLLAAAGNLDWRVLTALAVFYLAFAAWLLTPRYYPGQRLMLDHLQSLSKLNIPRAGGIRIPAKQAQEYEEIVRLVQAHATGKYIYAGPDSPEIYFLSGYQNPTRTLFAFLDPDFLNPGERTRRILGLIDRDNINLVVLHEDSQFSGSPPAQLRVAIGARFPQSETVDSFEVRWK